VKKTNRDPFSITIKSGGRKNMMDPI